MTGRCRSRERTVAQVGVTSSVRCLWIQWQSLCMPRLPRRAAWLLFVTIALAVAGAVIERAASVDRASAAHNARPRVTNRCPIDTQPLRGVDLPALRRLALELGLHGVHKAGSETIDYRDARAKASFPTFYTGYVRIACPRRLVKRVIARTADVLVRYPRVNWSASLSFSIFLVSRTPHGLVCWAQMH